MSGAPDPKTSAPGQRLRWWLAASAWAALIFALSARPDLPSGFELFVVPGADKLAHAAAFAVLALLLERASSRPLLALLLASLYGVSDELHQSGVVGRVADPFDWLADTLGAAAALAAVSYLRRKRAQQRVE